MSIEHEIVSRLQQFQKDAELGDLSEYRSCTMMKFGEIVVRKITNGPKMKAFKNKAFIKRKPWTYQTGEHDISVMSPDRLVLYCIDLAEFLGTTWYNIERARYQNKAAAFEVTSAKVREFVETKLSKLKINAKPPKKKR